MSTWPEIHGGPAVLRALDAFAELQSLNLLTDSRASAVCEHQPSVLRQVAEAISTAIEETTKAIDNADLKDARKRLRSERRSDPSRMSLVRSLKEAEAEAEAAEARKAVPRDDIETVIANDPGLFIEENDDGREFVRRKRGWFGDSDLDWELTHRLNDEQGYGWPAAASRHRQSLQQFDDETKRMVAAVEPVDLISRRAALIDLEVIVRAARIVALDRTLGP